MKEVIKIIIDEDGDEIYIDNDSVWEIQLTNKDCDYRRGDGDVRNCLHPFSKKNVKCKYKVCPLKRKD